MKIKVKKVTKGRKYHWGSIRHQTSCMAHELHSVRLGCKHAAAGRQTRCPPNGKIRQHVHDFGFCLESINDIRYLDSVRPIHHQRRLCFYFTPSFEFPTPCISQESGRLSNTSTSQYLWQIHKILIF